MGREVRRVPASWKHPMKNGEYIPLIYGDYGAHINEWLRGEAMWSLGFKRGYEHDDQWIPKEGDEPENYVDWVGARPISDDYMPAWPDHVRTHLMMYEDTSEGTPLSPAFSTPEELARWCADNNVSAFGEMVASYDAWLHVAYGNWAPGMVISATGRQSGVEAAI